MRRPPPALPWLLLVLAVADWVALRTGVAGHPPGVLAGIVALVMAALLARLAAVARDLAAGRRPRGVAAGETVLIGGVALALSAGMVNWLLGLQGFVILQEGEAVPLHGGSHLQHFEGGPLAHLEEMEVVLTFDELELVPAGDELYFPRSRLTAQRGREAPESFAIDRHTAGVAGPLRFYQGAFGFAPRIVVLRGGEEIFDRVVPFTSQRHGPTGVAFEGLFEIESEGLEIQGAVDLESLDQGMRGHATLHLTVFREGSVLGRGSLLPGHFAEIAGGYRIGFAGLERWTEVDISRRNYGRWVLAGAALALVGGLLWPLARWRGW